MQRVVFADSWSQYFAEFGLESFEDFFEYSTVQTIGINKKRSVVTFTLGEDSGKKRFFMKRFFQPHIKDMFFSWRNLGHLCSQGRLEWENARLLLDNDIGTYKPVCYGEQIIWGFETKSFCITEELQADCLTAFLRSHWGHMKQDEKERFMASMAAFIRKIHALNIDMPDLYVWHTYVNRDKSAGEYGFAVIDLHRMARNVKNSNRKIKNLGRLHHSMIDEYFDDKLKRLLIESYADDGSLGDVNALITEVEKYSSMISTKRRQKQY